MNTKSFIKKSGNSGYLEKNYSEIYRQLYDFHRYIMTSWQASPFMGE